MSSDINLDFQDYAPTSSGGNLGQEQLQQQEAFQDFQVKTIPSSGTSKNSKSNDFNDGRSHFDSYRKAAGQSASTEGLSEETIRELLWLSGKQLSQQQRGSIKASGHWGLGYLAQYFDVTTRDVIQRIVWSAVPIRKLGIDFEDVNDPESTAPLTSSDFSQVGNFNESNQGKSGLYERIGSRRKRYSYMERFIQSRPDLYGPFWISATLIFAVAIFSNLRRFIDFRAKLYDIDLQQESLAGKTLNANASISELNISRQQRLNEMVEGLEWHYSMSELNMAASVVICFVTILPTALWFFFWVRGCTKYYTLTETICAYGYSLAIFVPASALLMVQVTPLRYLVISIASLTSGLVLAMSFLPVVQSGPQATGSHLLLVLVTLFQVALAYTLHRIMLQ